LAEQESRSGTHAGIIVFAEFYFSQEGSPFTSDLQFLCGRTADKFVMTLQQSSQFVRTLGSEVLPEIKL
jgi:hypothetical protein